MDCLFCKIIEGKIPSTKVYEDQKILAFYDIQKLAKIHILFIHKKHCSNINAMMEEDISKVSEIFIAITKYTKQHGLEEKGFRIVTNTGPDAGQTIFHTHFHLLAGGPLGALGAFRK